MNPSTLQQIGRLYLQTSWCPAPLTAAEVQAHRAAKVELHQICSRQGPVTSPSPAAVGWIRPADSMPDDDTTVLVFVPDADAELVWVAYHSAGRWTYADGMDVGGVVTHWRHLPDAPAVVGKPGKVGAA